MIGVTAVAPVLPAFAVTTKSVTAPSVVINEVETSNFALNADETGKYGDWIELYNTTGASINLGGWGLSNASKNPFRWVFNDGMSIAAKGYLRVWADKADRNSSVSNLHTNFNLDNGIDSVYLSAPNSTVKGQLIDSTTPLQTLPNYSWCRMPNVTGDFTVCVSPSMAKANSGSTIGTAAAPGTMLASPVLSLKSGQYTATQTLTVTGPSGATLRYTTDDTIPTATSTVFPASLSITKTTVVRVAAFADGHQSSATVTGTYVFGGKGAYDGQRALYITMLPSGASSYIGHGTAPSSGWDSNLQMIDENGTDAFNVRGVTDSAGQSGSRRDQHTFPMTLKFKDAMGASSINYKVFPNLATTSFDQLRLRNGGNDNYQAHLRDQFWQGIGTEFDAAPAASEPVQLFVNGSYQGVMDLRQKEDEGLIASSYTGVDKDNVEYWNDGSSSKGDNTVADFNTLYNYITGNDMSVAANYAKASAMLDMQNFAADFALHMYAAGGDWQDKNMHAYRALDYDGKWRYRAHDFDVSSLGSNPWGHDTSASSNMNGKYDGGQSGTMMKDLLKNATFKNLYANTIADQLNTIFTPTEYAATLKSFVDPMVKYMPANAALTVPSVATWNAAVAKLGTWATVRPKYYIANTQSYLGVAGLNSLSVQTSDPKMGTVQVGDINLASRMTAANTSWSGSYWANVPVTLTAKPVAGYVFTGWSGDNTSTDLSIQVSAATAGKTYKANFAKAATVAAPSVTAIADQVGTTGTVVSLQVAATDSNGYTLSYSDSGLPSGLSVNSVTGLIYGKPTIAGTYSSTITVKNGVKATNVKLPITWTITNRLDRVFTLPTTIAGDGTGLSGAYYANATLSGTPALTNAAELPACTLTAGQTVSTKLPTSGWSVAWTGSVTVPVAGTYTLQTVKRSDDRARVILGGKTVIDGWTSTNTGGTAAVALAANTATPIEVDLEDASDAVAFSLNWKTPGSASFVTMPKGVFDPTTITQANPNLARTATATASTAAKGQGAAAAIDGVVAGYPGNDANEWSSSHEKAGAWLLLTWAKPQTIDRVYLYDRPNTTDQITGGTLTFSDGTTVAVPSLDNAGAATVVMLGKSITTSTVKLTVTSVAAGTSNVGLAEIEAYNGDPAATTTP